MLSSSEPPRLSEKNNFLFGGIFFGLSRGSFSKINLSKRTFPLVKLGSDILYLFLAEKIVVFLFVAILCPILAYIFFN